MTDDIASSLALYSELMPPKISDHAIGIFGLAIGVVGIIAGIITSAYFYYKAQQRALPRFALKDEVLLDPSATGTENFTISYEKEPVTNAVRKATLALWNAGNKTIDRSDISDFDHPRLIFPHDARIFTHKVSSPARSANALRGVQGSTGLTIEFAFLDQGDGGVIEVLYEGKGGGQPQFEGTIKGIPKGFELERSLTLTKSGRPAPLLVTLPSWGRSTIVVLYSGVLISIALSVFFVNRLDASSSTDSAILFNVLSLGVVLAFFVVSQVAIIFILIIGRRQVRNAVPSNVRKIFNEGKLP